MKMIPYEFGEFTDEQMEEYIKKLHAKLFFLLLYVDPNTKDDFEDENVDVKKYFRFLLYELDGLNTLLNYPSKLVETLSVLRFARKTLDFKDFNYRGYRKLILDAQSLIDQMFDEIKGVSE